MPRPVWYSCPGGGRKISILERLKGALKGARGQTEHDPDGLDQPNLRRKIVDRILRLKRWGPKGAERLPPVVAVSIEVGEGSIEVVQSFVDDPELDREVEADLLNRLVKIRPDGLPVRLYNKVRPASRNRVDVQEAAEGNVAWLEIEGGDQDGMWHPITTSQAECRLGRGAWHGGEKLTRNDIMVSESDRFVSRRAAVLRRVGSGLAVEALDQGDDLAVVRGSQRVRPTHVRGGAVAVRPGDVIEFNNGGSKTVKVRIHSQLPTPGR